MTLSKEVIMRNWEVLNQEESLSDHRYIVFTVYEEGQYRKELRHKRLIVATTNWELIE